MAVPHPLPYIQLAKCISDNWDELKFTASNDESRIKPQEHSDGRLIIMDYETAINKVRRVSKTSFGKKFIVRTDISNCFPSIYSHSIPWALVGMPTAKNTMSDRDIWYNKLDRHQRMMKRNETVGVPIGPATSNVIVEAILGKIDEALVQEGFVFAREGSFSRFIDDYTAYCNSHEDARRFLSFLGDRLEQYKLVINAKKTEFSEQPTPLNPLWLSELSTRLSGSHTFAQIDAIRYLDFALTLMASNPDGSVLKYVAKSLLAKAKIGRPLLSYLLNLSFYHPILLPLFYTRLPNTALLRPFKDELLMILGENARNKRSDGMVWAIYYLKTLGFEIPSDLASMIRNTEDCFAITLLYLSSPDHEKLVVDFANWLLDQKDIYLADRYWLLLYQLFFDSKIPNPYEDETLYADINFRQSRSETQQQARDREVKIFNELKTNGISFVL